jgi:hypothetical protein
MNGWWDELTDEWDGWTGDEWLVDGGQWMIEEEEGEGLVDR